MNPARFKIPIEIQAERTFKDPDTKITRKEWVTIRKCRAQFSQPRGRNYYRAAVAHKEYVTWFYVRHTDGIETGMRVLYKNRKYEVEQVNPDFQNRKILGLQCREVA